LKNLRGHDKITASKHSSTRKSDIKLDMTFLESYVFCESAHIWRGKAQTVAAKPYKDRIKSGEEVAIPISPPTHFYSTTGRVLYADVLCLVSRGRARCKQYFELYHIEGDIKKTKRSRKMSDLSMVQITDDALIKELEYGISTNVGQLAAKAKNIYNIERLQQELALLNDELEEKNLDVIVPEKKKGRISKEGWATALVQARKEMKKLAIDQGEDWEAKERMRVISRFEGTRNKPLEIIEMELADSFFHFADTDAKKSEMATEKICFKHTLESEGDSTFVGEANYLGSNSYYQMVKDSGYL